MEEKAENVKQSPKSAKPPIERGETQSKPKTGKIVRVVQWVFPFPPKGLRRYMSCLKVAQVTKHLNPKGQVKILSNESLASLSLLLLSS